MSKSSSTRSHWPVTALTVVASLFNLFLPIVLVRLLNPHEVGVYKLFFLYASVLPAFTLAPGLVSGLAYWSGRGEQGEVAVSTSGWSMIAIAVLVCCIGLVITPSLANHLEWSLETTSLFVIYTSSLIAGGFFEEAAIASGRSWLGAGFFSVFEVVKMVAVVGTAVYFRTLHAVLVVYAALSVIKLFAGYLTAFMLRIVRCTFAFSQLLPVVQYSLPVGLAWMFGVFIEKSDQLVLSTLIPPHEFALYALGCLAVPPLFAIEQSVTRVLIPQLSTAFHLRKNRGAATLFSHAVEQLALVLVPAAAGMCIFAEPIVSILFGAPYQEASIFMRFFALSYLALIVPGDAVARATGSSGWILKSFILFSIVSITLSAVGAWSGGALGALIGFLVSRFVVRAICFLKSLSLGGWKASYTLPWANLARIFILTLILSLGSIICSPLFPSTVWWFFIMGPLFTVLYFGMIFFFLRLPSDGDTEPRRVAMLLMNLQLGGLERMATSLALELKSTGRWEPEMVCYESGEIPGDASLLQSLSSADIGVSSFSKKPGFSMKIAWRIAGLCRAKQIYVVHAHNLSAAMYAVLAKFFMGGRLRIIYTQHTLVHVQAQTRYRWYEWVIGRIVERVVVMSPEIQSFYRQLGISEPKTQMIPNGVDTNSSLSAKKSELRETLCGLYPYLRAVVGKRWVLALSRVDAIKGQTRLAAVWSSLPPSVREESVVIFVGPETTSGEIDRVKEAARDSLGSSLFITGEGGDAKVWMTASDVFISASHFEGMPLAPLEALAAGLPLILSDIEGHSFLQEVAEYLPSKDMHSAVVTLSAFLSKGAALCAPGTSERNRVWVSQRYGLSKCREAYERVYVHS